MKRVLVDVDGVSADFVSATLEGLVRLGGPQMSPLDWTDWDPIPLFPEEFREPIKQLWLSRGFCEQIDVIKGARDGIEELRGVAEVHFVTAPFPKSEFWLQERMAWLRRHFGATEYDVTFTHKKAWIQADMLVDDKTTTVCEWSKLHPFSDGVLWAAPYNTVNSFHSIPPNVNRVHAWSTVVDAIRFGGGK